MNILYADPIVYSPTSNKYKYYNGLCDGLKEVANVFVYNKPFNDLKAVINETGFVPDFVIFGFGWLGSDYFIHIKNLDVPVAAILFKPQNNLEKKFEFCRNNDVDIVFATVPQYKKYGEIIGKRTELLTYGYYPEFFYSRKAQRDFDIGFSGALHQNKLYKEGAFETENIRVKIGDKLSRMDCNVFWNASDDASKAFIDDYLLYAKTMANSKLWVCTPAPFGDISARCFEILGSSTIPVCPTIPEEFKEILIPDVNCLEFSYNLSDFEEKITDLLSDNEKLNRMSRYFIDNQANEHCWVGRAKKVCEVMKEYL